MAGSFRDYDKAAKMRDLIAKVAENTVNRMRPEAMVGEVYRFDPETRYAYIRLPGHNELELVRARFADNMVPTASVENGDETPNVVRIGGKAGNWYIMDYVLGTPVVAAHTHPDEQILPGDWTNLTDTAGDAPFASNTAGTFRYREFGPLIHMQVVKPLTATRDLSANTTGDFTNVDICQTSSIPAAIRPSVGTSWSGRLADSPVTGVLLSDGRMVWTGGYPRNYTGGQLVVDVAYMIGS